MSTWSRLTLGSAEQIDELLAQTLGRPIADGMGIFRAADGLSLYFSPVATASLASAAAEMVMPCDRPDEGDVDLVVGVFPDPAWYDQPTEAMTADLDMVDLDDMGLIGPDTDIEATRREVFGR